MKSVFLAIVHVLLIVMLVGCATDSHRKSIGYTEPIDANLTALGVELTLAFPDILTPSEPARRLYESTPWGDKNRVADIHGYIPVERASVDDQDLCNRTLNHNCVSYVFGGQLEVDTEAKSRIIAWLQNVCTTMPVAPASSSSAYYTVAERKQEIKRLRDFLACDKQYRTPFTIYVFVAPNINYLFRNFPDRDSALRKEARLIDRVTVK